MSQIIVTTDSAADFPPQWQQKIPYPLVPLYITVGEKTGKDGDEMCVNDMFEAHRKHKIFPKTAAVSVGDHLDLFNRVFADHGDDAEIIHITLSAALSATNHNATLAAAEAKGKVHVFDSNHICGAQALLCMEAIRLRDQGLPAAQILAQLEAYRPRVKAHYRLERLDFVAHGGRVPKLKLLLASALQVRPSLYMDGLTTDVQQGKKYRGSTGATQAQWVQDMIAQYAGQIDPSIACFYATPDVPLQTYQTYQKQITAGIPEVAHWGHTNNIGCVLSAHAGPLSLAVAFVTKS